MKLHFWRDVAFGGCLRAKRRLIYFTSFSVFLLGYVLSALPASCASQASPIRLILSVCGLLTICSWVQHCMRAEGIISLSISFAAYFLRMTVFSYVFCDRLCTVSSSFWKVFWAYSRCYSLLMRYATCSFALVASRTLCCVWCKQRKINRDTAHALMMREGSALCQGSCSVSENLSGKSFVSL